MDITELRTSDLSSLPFNDYVRRLNAVESALPEGRPLRVAILRSYTIEPVEPVLKLRLLLEGFSPVLWFGGYNQYVQEILDSTSPLHEFKPDLVLMMTRIEEVMPGFVDDFAAKTFAHWDQALRAKARELGALAQRTVNALSAQVIVQNMTLLRAPYFGVFDSQQPEGQLGLLQRFNHELTSTLVTTKGAFVWDFDAFVRAKGSENLRDAKAWYVSRNPFKQSVYPAIVDDLMRYLRGALGRVKKCVVVDLDNTLWGGIAGEDGMEGIRLGHSYPGNCYCDFQRALLRLYDRGILLAINSKNNEADALRIIDEHPDMILRRRHFAAMRINWLDKAGNLREIARELNIGLDSLVFVDDSPVECELIRRECPECDVVLLPDKPYLLPDALTRLPGIENIALTEEDRRKGEMYRAQAARHEAEQHCSDLGEFLRSLEIEVRIEAATPFSIPRIAQLTQKTNQMNMTTRRYTDAQIESLADDPACAVYGVSSKDRFGDEGIIGVFILRFVANECVIDTFLLSCRVIGRGIEDAMIAFIADLARARGARCVIGEFFPTPKNHPAVGFYEKVGLLKVGESRFRADTDATVFVSPEHLRVTAAPARHSEPA